MRQTKETADRKSVSKLITPPRRTAALRMAPLIDVIFLLLIFFFVAVDFRSPESFLPFQLPTAEAAQTALGKAEPMVVRITAAPDGCFVKLADHEQIQILQSNIENNLAALLDDIAGTITRQKRLASDPIEIICAPDVKWRHLTNIYNLFYGAGLTDITFHMTE